jgi:biopolymer transport protein ExbD
MLRKSRLEPIKQISEINLTPLLDLTFILLITFIITFPLIEQGISVNLPKGDADPVDDLRSRTITIDADGVLYLDERDMEADLLSEELKRLGSADPDVTILVRADVSIPYGTVMKVMQMLHEAKITRVALVTQAENQ